MSVEEKTLRQWRLTVKKLRARPLLKNRTRFGNLKPETQKPAENQTGSKIKALRATVN
jgi:hypothetical protein